MMKSFLLACMFTCGRSENGVVVQGFLAPGTNPVYAQSVSHSSTVYEDEDGVVHERHSHQEFVSDGETEQSVEHTVECEDGDCSGRVIGRHHHKHHHHRHHRRHHRHHHHHRHLRHGHHHHHRHRRHHRHEPEDEIEEVVEIEKPAEDVKEMLLEDSDDSDLDESNSDDSELDESDSGEADSNDSDSDDSDSDEPDSDESVSEPIQPPTVSAAMRVHQSNDTSGAPHNPLTGGVLVRNDHIVEKESAEGNQSKVNSASEDAALWDSFVAGEKARAAKKSPEAHVSHQDDRLTAQAKEAHGPSTMAHDGFSVEDETSKKRDASNDIGVQVTGVQRSTTGIKTKSNSESHVATQAGSSVAKVVAGSVEASIRSIFMNAET